ncbi:MAG: T9SS type A sorting domain-containing protein, partial [Bacteroidia bacterium]|nr:T9SS type A sorting domain-containing protein [Bacteroidia bacterium]
PSCFGQCNGVLNSNGSGATAPYTYQLSQASVVCTSASCTALCAGVYTLQVSSANGCSTSTIVSLTQPTALSATASSTNATCSSCTNGAVSASVSGGTTPYTYSWTPISANTPTIGNLAVGCYTVIVTDAKGCVDTETTCVSFSTKIEELQHSTSHLSMYPNPNNGIFTVSSIQLEERMKIEITNTMGQVVSNERFTNVTQVNVNLSSFAKGIYYVKVNTKDGTQLFKLLIQ